MLTSQKSLKILIHLSFDISKDQQRQSCHIISFYMKWASETPLITSIYCNEPKKNHDLSSFIFLLDIDFLVDQTKRSRSRRRRHHHQSYVPTMMGSATWILLLHSDVSWAKSPNKLHFFLFVFTTSIYILFSQLLPLHGPSTYIA